jgi:hypothetical protein
MNRNSSPQALSTIRDAYDRLLLKFPLFFGYWKKYADLEFNIAGPESAEMVRSFFGEPFPPSPTAVVLWYTANGNEYRFMSEVAPA